MKYFKILLLGVIISFSFSYGQTIDRTIIANSDDAEERASDGGVELTSTDMDLGSKRVGLRFTNITIPQGATITNAYLQFTADENETGNVSLRIRGNDVDDAVTFVQETGNVFTNRARTTSFIIWTPGNWTQGNSGVAQRTPNISSVVQEIIDRGGWDSGNSIAFLITSTIGYNANNERAADSHEQGTPAQLHIEYTTPSTNILRVLATGADDAEEYTTTGTSGYVELSSQDLDLREKIVGLRFSSVNVPQGATINNAYIQFISKDATSTTNEFSLRIEGHDIDNSGAFQIGVTHDISTREKTTASVNWSPPQWTPNHAGAAQRTPDLSSIVQELVNRDNWAGQHMTFILVTNSGASSNHTREARSLENGAGAELHIEYSEGATSSSGILSSGDLTLEIENTGSGVRLIHMRRNGTELLNQNANINPNLFTLNISGSMIGSATGWDNVNMINNNGTTLTLELSNPTNTAVFPSTLEVTVTITVIDGEARWDMSVAGLNNRSLFKTWFPRFNIIASGNDHFLLPRASGQVVDNPRAPAINSTLDYPRGSRATMQFSAYYNDNYGIYFGTHDPTASFKSFRTVARSGGVEHFVGFTIPDSTINGNDWDMPGYFSLELFEGNWYDAAQLYRTWASSSANFWPTDTQERRDRQAEIGRVGAWAYISGVKDAQEIRSLAETFQNDFGVPIGFHWFGWTEAINGDELYPHYFPAINGMQQAITQMQASGDIYPMPYVNSRLYDTNLGDYAVNGEPFATKDVNGNVNTQHFNDPRPIDFAVMCPTQDEWQDNLGLTQERLTSNEFGANVVYLDQLCHAIPRPCMDASHGHSLGSGSLWRNGYKEMLSNMHARTPSDVFYVGEGATDYLNDEVDGLYTLAWLADGLVPAYEAVYSGVVQTFGITFGSSTYNTPVFYSKFAQNFSFGIQPGGISLYLSTYGGAPDATAARNYLRELATLRFKLREFMSFGRMLKPLLDVSNRPTITTDWGNADIGVINVTSSALQQSIWKNDDDDKVLITFANASMTTTLNNITIDILGTNYGLSGNLRVQRINEGANGNAVTEPNHFVRTISLAPLEVYCIVLESTLAKEAHEEVEKVTYKLDQNYPNPFNPSTVINFSIANAGNTKVEIFNILGQKVMTLLNRDLEAGSHNVKFNASNLSSGIYFYRLQSNNFTSIKKMMLLK